MVDEALAETCAVQSRLRDLPSRVVVYLLLAACLFPELGYPGVWAKLTGGLRSLPTATPTAAGCSRRAAGWAWRRCVGCSTCYAAVPPHPARWRGLLVCAIDCTPMSVPDSRANLTGYSKHRCNNGGSGYPLLRLVAVVACGTRTIIDVVFGPTTTGEITYVPRLARTLRAGMILLLVRNFAACDLIGAVAATGAEVMVRLKNSRVMPVLARFADGSYLSVLGSTKVRVVDAEIAIVTSTGCRTGLYRLPTTLGDHHHYPAAELVALYHQQWEIETAYLELKSTTLGGRVLRART
ncbi:transposase [Saccharopolyspora erythraea]|uniref:transposase n=1 Tax=Saccharopolyspora erythraea TaxID=1836 RepID=UPI0020110B7A|nr:transposase [Saccharopolyspora erythraea]